MDFNENNILETKNQILGSQHSNIITREHVLREYKVVFNVIEKLLDKSEMILHEFEVGKTKSRPFETIYFYPGASWGFISFDELGGCGTHKLEDILEDLYPPKQIRNNLIQLLTRFSRINQKKIDKLNSELGLVKDLLLHKIQ